MKRRSPRRDGASLLEVVLAAAIFSILALALAQLSLTVDRSNTFASERRAAVAAASRQLEEIKVLTNAEILSRDGAGFAVEEVVDDRAYPLKPDPSPGPDGQVWTQPGRVFIDPVANGAFVRVDIWVRWRSSAGPGQVRLTWGRSV